ncbi:hypothetical protein FQR65_LT19608 [Abscondita terminalis]|nr:hypothetical protein FQR65_LT19608 [Abscondita terminalis]
MGAGPRLSLSNGVIADDPMRGVRILGSAQDIGMVEGEANEISEAEMVEANCFFAHEAIKKQIAAQVECYLVVLLRNANTTTNHQTPELREAIFGGYIR